MNSVKLNPNYGGGVAVFINEKLNFSRLSFEGEFVPRIYESIWIKINLGRAGSVIIGNVYRPGSNNLANTNSALDLHNKIICNIKNNPLHKKCPIFLVGDFNLDLIKYSQCEVVSNYANNMSSFGLLPVIVRPTRFSNVTGCNAATLIDHVFSSSKSAKFGGILLSDISDHYPVFVIDYLKCVGSKCEEIIKCDTSSKNIDNLCSYLKNVSWSPILDDSDPISATEGFFKIVEDATNTCFPPKTVKHRKKHPKNILPWFSAGLARCSKKKNQLFKKKI